MTFTKINYESLGEAKVIMPICGRKVIDWNKVMNVTAMCVSTVALAILCL